MQQRRLRLGDILDDYCPRERRITNHAVVAMIDDQVKQTRCTTCNADHEYKQARVPPPRRKKDALVASMPPGSPEDNQDQAFDEAPVDDVSIEVADAIEVAEATEAVDVVEHDAESAEEEPATEENENLGSEDEGPVHRRLIRATLPRPEGQSPDRKEPDFTVRQPGGRGREFDGNRSGGGAGGGGQRNNRGRRAARGPQDSFSGPSRFGGPRQNSPHGGQRQNANRPGPSSGQRSGGRPQGQSRGPGRKRGR